MRRHQPDFRIPYFLFLAGMILAMSIAGCTGSPQETPEAPKITFTADPAPVPDLSLADQYLVVGISAGDFAYLKQEPGGADLAASLPFGTVGLQPTGEVRKIQNEVWIEVNTPEATGWIQFQNLAEQRGELPADLVMLAQQTAAAIRDRDYQSLEPRIHPEMCLRFSPYFYLNPDNRILCQADLEQIGNQEKLLWGHYDGTGLPINLTFWEYHDLFVYDQDYFNAPIVGLNVEVGSGNSINNITEIYPDGMMVEYYFPGIDPQYGGLDWRSLRLVFVNLDGSWYLAAIIHGEWTI